MLVPDIRSTSPSMAVAPSVKLIQDENHPSPIAVDAGVPTITPAPVVVVVTSAPVLGLNTANTLLVYDGEFHTDIPTLRVPDPCFICAQYVLYPARIDPLTWLT